MDITADSVPPNKFPALTPAAAVGSTLAAVATADAPTRTEGQSDAPLSVDLDGNLRTRDQGIGLKDDPAAGTDTGEASLISLVKRLLLYFSDTSPAPVYISPGNELSGRSASITDTANKLLLAAPGAGLRNYITALSVSNAHATVGTDVEILDGNTVIWTVPASAQYGGAVQAFPTPLKQPTANEAINGRCAVTGANVTICVSGYKAA